MYKDIGALITLRTRCVRYDHTGKRKRAVITPDDPPPVHGVEPLIEYVGRTRETGYGNTLVPVKRYTRS